MVCLNPFVEHPDDGSFVGGECRSIFGKPSEFFGFSVELERLISGDAKEKSDVIVGMLWDFSLSGDDVDVDVKELGGEGDDAGDS